jgi:hypothetical protein
VLALASGPASVWALVLEWVWASVSEPASGWALEKALGSAWVSLRQVAARRPRRARANCSRNC